MTLEDLFGEPTELRVAEAVYLFRREEGDWPLWEEARTFLAEWKEIPEEEAERRILAAVRAGDVLPKLRGINAWGLCLDEATEDRLTRRYLAVKLFEDREESS